jgi:hypothetical protein
MLFCNTCLVAFSGLPRLMEENGQARVPGATGPTAFGSGPLVSLMKWCIGVVAVERLET